MRSLFFTASLLAFSASAACVGEDAPVVGIDSGSLPDGAAPIVDGAVNDVLPGTDAADAAAPWTPASWGTDLTLWLVGDLGVGLGDAGEVVSWADQSPSPVTLSGTGALADTTNGHGVMNFPGTKIHMSTASAPKLELGATDDVMLACVVQVLAGSSGLPGGFAWWKGTQGIYGPRDGMFFGVDVASATAGSGGMQINPGDGGIVTLNSSKKPFADNLYHLLVARRTGGGTALRVRSEGLEETATLPAPYDLSNGAEDLSIGSVLAPGDNFVASFALKFAEIVVVRRSSAFTAAEVSQLEAYEKAKYALP